MALTLLVRAGTVRPPPSITLDAPRIIIGRGRGCELCLPDPSVSHRHASIRQRGPDYIVVDEGSTNGTFVGLVRLPPQTPRVLRSGDFLRVGRIWLEVRVEQAPPTPQAQLATREIALGLVADALREEGEDTAVQVTVQSGPDAGLVLPLQVPHRPYVVGRAGTATGVALALTDEDASRRHAELTWKGGRIWVRDLGSKNGTLLGGEPIKPDQDIAWRAGTPLRIGQNSFEFTDPVADALAELERSADERMAEDQSVDPPPVGAEDPLDPDLVGGSAAGERPSTDEAPRSQAIPLAEVPKRPKQARPRRGWGLEDYAVALVALTVLGVSVAGLVWLFGP